MKFVLEFICVAVVVTGASFLLLVFPLAILVLGG